LMPALVAGSGAPSQRATSFDDGMRSAAFRAPSFTARVTSPTSRSFHDAVGAQRARSPSTGRPHTGVPGAWTEQVARRRVGLPSSQSARRSGDSGRPASPDMRSRQLQAPFRLGPAGGRGAVAAPARGQSPTRPRSPGDDGHSPLSWDPIDLIKTGRPPRPHVGPVRPPRSGPSQPISQKSIDCAQVVQLPDAPSSIPTSALSGSEINHATVDLTLFARAFENNRSAAGGPPALLSQEYSREVALPTLAQEFDRAATISGKSKYASLSVPELKAELTRRNLSVFFCFDKEDLIQRLLENDATGS